jgi:hypothetical protein
MLIPALLMAACLSACSSAPVTEVSKRETAAPAPALHAPPEPAPSVARVAPGLGSNAALARDILELSFRMESGATVPALSRFEGPVTLRLIGDVPAQAQADAADLVGRLRREAGIDIALASGEDAAITVQFLPRRQLRGIYANVACFVVPNVSGWAEFAAAQGSPRIDWTQLTARTRATVFIPSDSAPQEARDCLHEEVAQALGPLNDLYRLSNSVFNDDNFQTVLTGFDMAVLRVLYDPALASGMTEAEVAGRLPAILGRLNPGGASAQGAEAAPTPRTWQTAVEVALTGSNPLEYRIAAARKAIGMARNKGWDDGRLALSWFALGRLTLGHDPATALDAFGEAARIYRGLPGGAIHAAHVDMQLAAYGLAAGNHAEVLDRVEAGLPAAMRAENAALVATLLLMRAEALEALGRATDARAVRAEAMAWASYGFGGDSQARARATEIAMLARRGARS